MARQPFNTSMWQVLYLIYNQYFNRGMDGWFSEQEFDRFAPEGVGSFVVRKCVEELASLNFLDSQIILDSEQYELSTAGIRRVEQEIDDPNTVIGRFVMSLAGDFAQISDADLPPALEVEDVPASDRVVPLNHNGNDYRAAVAALDKALSEFREDRVLDNHSKAEKNALLKALHAGRELLDEQTLNYRIGVTLLLDPIKIVIQRYSEAAIETVVKVSFERALEFLIKLFSSGG